MEISTTISSNFFEKGSPYLAHPLLTAERTFREVEFIDSELNLPKGARLLDVGCGFGRHSIEFARRGYKVLGIDSSVTMIAAARERAAIAGGNVEFQQERGERFTAAVPFDAAICLFTTLGQISEHGENSGLVYRVYDALKPGGQFVIELPQRETAVRQLRPSDKFDTDVRSTSVTRHYEAGSHIISEIFRIVEPERAFTYLLRYKLYDKDELLALLEKAGFIVQAAYGDYEGSPLTDEHPIMVIVAQKV